MAFGEVIPFSTIESEKAEMDGGCLVLQPLQLSSLQVMSKYSRLYPVRKQRP